MKYIPRLGCVGMNLEVVLHEIVSHSLMSEIIHRAIRFLVTSSNKNRN